MSSDTDGPFTSADLRELSEIVLACRTAGVDNEWQATAGTLDWTCFATADHLIDCVFSYALFLASRKLDGYPKFGELLAEPNARPVDLIDGLRAVTTMLSAVIETAEPGARAVFWRTPRVEVRGSQDFAARGGLEMILHAHDVCAGLGIDFVPPADLCRRLFEHTRDWPGQPDVQPTDDPWADVLQRSGR